MDGKNLKRKLQNLLNMVGDTDFFDERSGYDYLYAAARQWVIETECLSTTQSITTVAKQAAYTLSGDFLALYLKNNGKYYIKFYDGSDYTFIDFRPYEDVIYDDNTTSVAIPSYFTLKDDPTLDTLVSDTADNDGGSAVGGKATLTMNTAVFTDVTPGDIIHNTTDGSDGVVVSTESTGKILGVCLFGGTDNEIDASDAFVIQPRKRMQLVFDPPPLTADYTATVYYLQSPPPVYSDYDVYKLPYDYSDALVHYAAWLFKYRDQKPDIGDRFFLYWKDQITEARRLTYRGFAKEESRIIPKFRR